MTVLRVVVLGCRDKIKTSVKKLLLFLPKYIDEKIIFGKLINTKTN